MEKVSNFTMELVIFKRKRGQIANKFSQLAKLAYLAKLAHLAKFAHLAELAHLAKFAI